MQQTLYLTAQQIARVRELSNEWGFGAGAAGLVLTQDMDAGTLEITTGGHRQVIDEAAERVTRLASPERTAAFVREFGPSVS